MTGSTSSGHFPWQEIALSIGMTVLFFGLLELGLRVAGIESVHASEDPFVGFASNVPLFVPQIDSQGQETMVTAGNKRGFFNLQQFPRQKGPGTYRIFCLGGSTTYGRPYDDRTSFAGWLRQLLTVAYPETDWEVINAGGISYASYRIVALMEELVTYEPDLFIVYSGHNEFLEERTYRTLRSVPPLVRSVVSSLSTTRTWAAGRSLLRSLGFIQANAEGSKFVLPEVVDAKLDHSAGPALYQRDDRLQSQIIEHFSISLKRLTAMARSVGAEILLVTPASNLKDFTPFKSQSTDSITDERRRDLEVLLKQAVERTSHRQWNAALEVLDRALKKDPRSADLLYRKGRAQFELADYSAAQISFQRARDEDVCPLRAVTSIQQVVREVAREEEAILVDFVSLLEQMSQEEAGHRISGERYFLDHVHPTIDGHRHLAVAILRALEESGEIDPSAEWSEDTIDRAATEIESRIDDGLHARALANLALTLDWAGKDDDSRRLAFRALESGFEDPTILMMVARHSAAEGEDVRALDYFRRAVQANPGNPVSHLQIGLFHSGRKELEAAAAHFFMASLIWPENGSAHQQLANIQKLRQRYESALASLLAAQRIDSTDGAIKARIDETRRLSGNPTAPLPPRPRIAVSTYDSGAVQTVSQSRMNHQGMQITHGIWTEWYENGTPKRFAEYASGKLDGTDVSWNSRGEETSRLLYSRGAKVDAAQVTTSD